MSFKHSIRDSWLAASYAIGVSELYKKLWGRKRGIISYHNVLPLSKLPHFDTYNVDQTVEVFEKQIQFLQKHFRILPIQELSNPKAEGFFITVDDGMANNYSLLAPILDKYDISALFAICPALVDGQYPHIWRDHLFLLLRQYQHQPIWLPFNHYREPFQVGTNGETLNKLTRKLKKYVYEQQVADIYGLLREICQKNEWSYGGSDEEPLRYQFMNWSQIQDLHRRGHSIASHTMTHRVLKFLPDHEKQYELIESKKHLENQLGASVDTIVYPYGSLAEIDESTIAIAQEAGYRLGLMNIQTHSLSNPMLALPRFAFPPIDTPAHLHAIASGYKFLFR